MKKYISILLMTSLMGCVSHKSDEFGMPVMEGNYPINQQYEVLPVQNIVLQPDEEIQALQSMDTVETSLDTPSAPAQDGAYAEWLAKKLRKELRSTGIQVKEVSGQIDLIIPTKLAFGNNQAKLQTKFTESLENVAKLLKEYNTTMIQIIGYTDNTGPVLVNKEASLKKADIIADYLRGQGISSERIITDGAGADNPVGNNMTAKGRELNRRIEMTLISLQ